MQRDEIWRELELLPPEAQREVAGFYRFSPAALQNSMPGKDGEKEGDG